MLKDQAQHTGPCRAFKRRANACGTVAMLAPRPCCAGRKMAPPSPSASTDICRTSPDRAGSGPVSGGIAARIEPGSASSFVPRHPETAHYPTVDSILWPESLAGWSGWTVMTRKATPSTSLRDWRGGSGTGQDRRPAATKMPVTSGPRGRSFTGRTGGFAGPVSPVARASVT